VTPTGSPRAVLTRRRLLLAVPALAVPLWAACAGKDEPRRLTADVAERARALGEDFFAALAGSARFTSATEFAQKALLSFVEDWSQNEYLRKSHWPLALSAGRAEPRTAALPREDLLAALRNWSVIVLERRVWVVTGTSVTSDGIPYWITSSLTLVQALEKLDRILRTSKPERVYGGYIHLSVVSPGTMESTIGAMTYGSNIALRQEAMDSYPDIELISTLCHEYVHCHQRKRAEDPMPVSPLWMIEGSADFLAYFATGYRRYQDEITNKIELDPVPNRSETPEWRVSQYRAGYALLRAIGGVVGEEAVVSTLANLFQEVVPVNGLGCLRAFKAAAGDRAEALDALYVELVPGYAPGSA
jgi:hypothetical protein